MQEKNNGGIIKSVQKSLRILKYIMNSPREVSLSDLEREFGYNTSTIFHLIKTLMQEGFVSQNKVTKKYDIGPEFLFYWFAYKQPGKFFNRVLPLLEKCANSTGETTNLFIRDGDEAVCLIGSESKQTLKAFLMIGRHIPLPCTAVGKVFLAFTDEQEALKTIQRVGLKKYMPNTIIEIDKLLEDIRGVRDRGYALEREEYEEMITAVAVPVFDKENNLISSVSTIIPTIRASNEKIQEVILNLTDISGKISNILGDIFY
ncbi:MAG: IclR family transcriptional regulator [Firmicutes bacterium]|nr:IclR family transcriptional regulator [Bacillota bacterium]